jgi:excisionase family DNA binding protein
MTNDFDPGDWITTKEAAELTGYTVVHMRRLVREGQVKSRKFGRAWMVDRESLLAYAAEMEQLGAAKHDPWRTGARKRKPED